MEQSNGGEIARSGDCEFPDYNPPRIAWSPDGRRLALVHRKSIELFAAEGMTAHLAFRSDNPLRDVAFTSDGKRLVEVGARQIKIRDLRSDGTAKLLATADSDIGGIAVDPGGTYVACAQRNGIVRTWSLATGDRLLSMRGATEAS